MGSNSKPSPCKEAGCKWQARPQRATRLAKAKKKKQAHTKAQFRAKRSFRSIHKISLAGKSTRTKWHASQQWAHMPSRGWKAAKRVSQGPHPNAHFHLFQHIHLNFTIKLAILINSKNWKCYSNSHKQPREASRNRRQKPQTSFLRP